MSKYKLNKVKSQTGLILYKNKPIVYGLISSELIDSTASVFSSDLMEDSKDVRLLYLLNGDKFTVIVNKNIVLEQILKNSNYTNLPYTDKIKETILTGKKEVSKAFESMNNLATIEDLEDTLKDNKLQSIKDEMLEYDKELQKYLKEVKVGISGNISEYLSMYEFKEHLLMVGERGASKTYTVTKYLVDEGIETEFIGCHNAIESIDLLGSYIKTADGSFVWKDGALSAAFRKASKGIKTALIMDEILRTPARELNILVAALTPDSKGNFNLRTDRIVNINDGIGETELLSVSKELLWIVATTNIGSDYDVEEIDIAFQDRFMTVEVQLTEDIIRTILYNYTTDEIIVNKLVEIYNKVNSAVEVQELAHKLNVRHLVKVLSYAGSDIKEIKQRLLHFIPNICSRNIDGKLNMMDVEVYKTIVKSF